MKPLEPVTKCQQIYTQHLVKNTSFESGIQFSSSISKQSQSSEISYLNPGVISCTEPPGSKCYTLNKEELCTVPSVSSSSSINMSAPQGVPSNSVKTIDVTSKLITVPCSGIKDLILTNPQTSLLSKKVSSNISESYSTLNIPRILISEADNTANSTCSSLVPSEITPKQTLMCLTIGSKQRVESPVNALSKNPKSNATNSLMCASLGSAQSLITPSPQGVPTNSVETIDATSKLCTVPCSRMNDTTSTNSQTSLLTKNVFSNMTESYSTLKTPIISISEADAYAKETSSSLGTSEITPKQTLLGVAIGSNQRIKSSLNALFKTPKSNAMSSSMFISQETSKQKPPETKTSLKPRFTPAKNESSENSKSCIEGGPLSEDSEITNVFYAKDSKDTETTHKYIIKTKLHNDGKTYQYLYREEGKTNKLIGSKELTEAETSLHQKYSS
ncbi:unnamed protein product [Meganyctiphanes norvegica]|uniref:Uncharacterized protein n=1 Tax=Meganyctiphanes norvegica TaxID=48144 RepID=A0AAV2SSF8_MEGNR